MAHDSSQTEGYAKLLHDAVCQGDAESVRKLVCEYKRPNELFEGRLPLVTAVRDKHHDVIKVLLEHGADVKLQDDSEMSILDVAICRRDHILLETLLGYCGSLADYAGGPLISNALEVGDEVMALMLIEHGADITKKGHFSHWPPLLLACGRLARGGRISQVVQKLLDMGADANDGSWTGMSPLMFASRRSNLATAEKLIDLGAELEAKDPAEGNTALSYAVLSRNLDMTKLLVRKGADVNQPLANDLTALSVAAEGNSPEIASFLLANGADVNGPRRADVDRPSYATVYADDRPTDALLTPLHLAAENGHADMARLLLDKGAQIDAASARGYTPLMLAAHNGYADTLSVLISRGADTTRTPATDPGLGHSSWPPCPTCMMGSCAVESTLLEPLGPPRPPRETANKPPRQYARVIELLVKAALPLSD